MVRKQSIKLRRPLRSGRQPGRGVASSLYSLGGLAFFAYVEGKARYPQPASLRSDRHGEYDGPILGNWRSLKVPMITDSRKPQRNSFAHHRAHLLFSALPQDRTIEVKPAARHSPDLSSLTQRVRAGLIGFVPSGRAAQTAQGALANA